MSVLTKYHQLTLTGITSLLFILIIASEILSPIPHVDSLGVILWLSISLIFAAFTFDSLVSIIRWTVFHRQPIPLIIIIALFVFFTREAGLPINFSNETAREIACGLDALTFQTGWQTTCYFGYPVRQFLAPAIVPLLLGRTLFALNFGAVILLFSSLTIFASGLIKFWRPTKATAIFVFTIASLFNFRFFHIWTAFFEQSLYPLIFCFTLVGLFLHYQAKSKPIYLWLLGLLFLQLAHAYPTTLALLALGVFLLTHRAIYPTHSLTRRHIGQIIFGTTISLLASLSYRQDLKLISDIDNQPLLSTIHESTQLFLGITTTNPLLTHLFAPILILAIVSLFLYKPTKFRILTSAWVLGVIAVSLFAAGVGDQSTLFKLHRILIIFPILIPAALAPVPTSFFVHHRLSVALLAIILFTFGFHMRHTYQSVRPISNSIRIYSLLNSQFDSQTEFTIQTQDVLTNALFNLSKSFTYFYPYSQNTFTSNPCNSSNSTLHLLIVLQKFPNCTGFTPSASTTITPQRQIKILAPIDFKDS